MSLIIQYKDSNNKQIECSLKYFLEGRFRENGIEKTIDTIITTVARMGETLLERKLISQQELLEIFQVNQYSNKEIEIKEEK